MNNNVVHRARVNREDRCYSRPALQIFIFLNSMYQYNQGLIEKL